MAENSSQSLFSREFHRRSKRLFQVGAKEPNPSLWPKEWTTTFFKKYSRLETILLPTPQLSLKIDFFSLLKNRSTRRLYSGENISLHELSTWLSYVCGKTVPLEDGRPRMTYPSGGARYSIEHYVLVLKETNHLKTGVYHYRADMHSLELLIAYDFSKDNLRKFITVKWADDAAFVHVMTSVFWRSQNKYNERGYRLVLLEAGHVGQNAYLVSGALGLGCCALSGVFDDSLEELFDIDGETESVVHAVVVGH